VGLMISEVTNKLYTNEQYLNYLRYNPRWYMVLDRFPDSFKEFEKEAKTALKITMQDKIGNEYEAIISSITNFGMYVKLDNTIEGLVTLSSLEDDYYIYNEKNMMLIGERTGKKYEIGQKVKVKVIRASIELRQIDFTIVED
jgi:ribonuclease R